jgi:hypothetical protein
MDAVSETKETRQRKRNQHKCQRLRGLLRRKVKPVRKKDKNRG